MQIPGKDQQTKQWIESRIRSDGLEVVLKVGVPSREVETEIAALRLWAGNGSVELLEAIPEKGALLLERLRPGTPLAMVDDVVSVKERPRREEAVLPSGKVKYLPFLPIAQ